MEFNLMLNEDTTSSANAPVEFSFDNEEDESNCIGTSACEPKSNIEAVIDITNKETQYGECHIMNDDNIRCAQRIKDDGQINIAKTHSNAKNKFLIRSLLKFLIREICRLIWCRENHFNESRNRQCFLGITCSWIDEGFKIHEALLTSNVARSCLIKVTLMDLENVIKDIDLENVIKDIDLENVVKDIDLENVVKDIDLENVVKDIDLENIIKDIDL
ncbi:14837_t:CDS:2 [Cetraspora pellucida]|uniref:14837_t:CDS:1 n=1 Tax=Cetraspora pellucida TaxID=1433469 RepID=A0ACA9P7Y8_9GLOM|nr:14837_t:CDS:2 [Cetraspora pellucida]